MNSIFLLIFIFRYGHCVNQTLTELEDWKNEIKAELKNEIFEELAETAEIRRIDSKLNEITKSNQEIITVVQDHGIKLNSLHELIEKLQENPGTLVINNKTRANSLEEIPVTCNQEENPNFRWINGRCYYFAESTTNFQGAKKICKDIFPKSLSPGIVFEGRSMSDEEKVFRATKTIDIHNTESTRDFWIGMNDESVEGQWIYDSDNTTVPDWALPKLRKSKPDIDATENCAWVRRGNFYRADSSCNNYQYVICESSMNIPEKKAISNILITTGYHYVGGTIEDQESKITEVISLDKKCNKEIAPFPFTINQATGGLVNEKPIICGGKDLYRRNQCYRLQNNVWSFLGNMTISRSSSAAVVLPESNELFITGGYTGIRNPEETSSTEYFNGVTGKSRRGPDLPKAESYHCMVILHNNTIMIIGGAGIRGQTSYVYTFNPKTLEYRTLPEKRELPTNFGCAIFKSANHENRPVVFIGGGSQIKSAELMDYTKTQTWEKIDDVPSSSSNLYGARAVATPDGQGVLLFDDGNIFQLSCNKNGCNWSTKSEKLQVQHRESVVMQVGQEFC